MYDGNVFESIHFFNAAITTITDVLLLHDWKMAFPALWQLIFVVCVLIVGPISLSLGQDVRSSNLDVTASSPLQMILSPSVKKLNSMEEETLKQAIAKNLLLWQVKVQSIEASAIYDDIEIVFQEVVLNLELETTSVRFFALATSSPTVIAGDGEAQSQHTQNELNLVIEEAFSSEDFQTQILDYVQTTSDDDESPVLMAIDDITVFLVAPAPIPTPAPVTAAVDRRRFSALDAILIFVSAAIFIGIVYMIVQHHRDQGYFENQRLQVINSDQRRNVSDGSFQGNLLSSFAPTGRMESSNNRAEQHSGSKGDSETPSTPSTIESILREDSPEFLMQTVSTPKRRGVRDSDDVRQVADDCSTHQRLAPDQEKYDVDSVCYGEEAEASYVPQETEVSIEKYEKEYLPKEAVTDILLSHHETERCYVEDKTVSELYETKVSTAPRVPALVPAEDNPTLGMAPFEMKPTITVADHLASTRRNSRKDRIIVETVTSLSSGYNSAPNVHVLAESFDSDWFLEEVKKSSGKDKTAVVRRESDDAASHNSTNSNDVFGIDVEAATHGGDASQESKVSSTVAITEWMKSIQVQTRKSTGSKTSAMSRSSGNGQSIGVASLPHPQSPSRGHSSSGVSSSDSSSSFDDDDTSSDFSSLDRLSIEQSMASSGVGGGSSISTSSTHSDDSRRSRTSKKVKSKRLPPSTHPRVEV